MTKFTPEAGAEVMNLVMQLRNEGEQVAQLEWDPETVSSLLLHTASRAQYLIETRPDRPSLVTRLSEAGPLLDYNGPRTEVVIFRHEGNPDRQLQVGKMVDIMGLSMFHTDRDPDGMYTMAPLVGIRYLPI